LNKQSSRHSTKPKRYVDEPDIDDESLDFSERSPPLSATPSHANGFVSTTATPTHVPPNAAGPAAHTIPSVSSAAIQAATEEADLEATSAIWAPLLESYRLATRRRALAFRQSFLSADKAASVRTAERIVSFAGERMVYLVESISEAERAAAEEEARRAEMRKKHEIEQAVIESALKDRKERKREAAKEGWKKRKLAKEEQEERRQEKKRARLLAWENELKARGEDPANHIPPPVDGPGWPPSLDGRQDDMSSLSFEDDIDVSDSDRRRSARKRKTADDLVMDSGYDAATGVPGYPPHYAASHHYYNPEAYQQHHGPYGAPPAHAAYGHPHMAQRPTYQYDPETGRPIAYGRHLPYGHEPEDPPGMPEEGQPMGRGARHPRSVAEKRMKTLEDAERRTWTQIAKTQIPKVSSSAATLFCRSHFSDFLAFVSP
jgi:hypothetical protein